MKDIARFLQDQGTYEVPKYIPSSFANNLHSTRVVSNELLIPDQDVYWEPYWFGLLVVPATLVLIFILWLVSSHSYTYHVTACSDIAVLYEMLLQ